MTSWLESLTPEVAITTITLVEILVGVRRITVGRDQAEMPISMADAQIAAICRAHHASCATRQHYIRQSQRCDLDSTRW
ncbi:hypothetical protein [Nesterenkonia muleiensis]|uniref:hypothetical protein n=1 Tax=Nesterenkonia muleiensis TaxID=2282648 RepID=UPI001EE448DB|nr:hypothetical protein [Nesterenkonia muleiensis]